MKISQCCKAKLKVSTGTEGTSCYICTVCNMPSDPMVEEIKLMDKWEYQIEKWVEQLSKEELDVFGKKGWQLCAVEYSAASHFRTYIFKRKLNN